MWDLVSSKWVFEIKFTAKRLKKLDDEYEGHLGSGVPGKKYTDSYKSRIFI